MLPTVLTLQERVRRFNLGTPTPMHMDTHYLVNDLWRANADILAALKSAEITLTECANIMRPIFPPIANNIITALEPVRAALAKAEPST